MKSVALPLPTLPQPGYLLLNEVKTSLEDVNPFSLKIKKVSIHPVQPDALD